MKKKRTKGHFYSCRRGKQLLDRHSTKVYQRFIETEMRDNFYTLTLSRSRLEICYAINKVTDSSSYIYVNCLVRVLLLIRRHQGIDK